MAAQQMTFPTLTECKAFDFKSTGSREITINRRTWTKTWTETHAGRKPERRGMIVKAELHYLSGNSRPYFSITSDSYSSEQTRSRDGWMKDVGGWDGGGCQHELILEHFPELWPLVEMHLSHDDASPMHAFANAWYWAGGTEYNSEFRKPDDYVSRYHDHKNEPPHVGHLAKHLHIDYPEAEAWIQRIRDARRAPAIRDGYGKPLDFVKAEFKKYVDSLQPQWQAMAETAFALLASPTDSPAQSEAPGSAS